MAARMIVQFVRDMVIREAVFEGDLATVIKAGTYSQSLEDRV